MFRMRLDTNSFIVSLNNDSNKAARQQRTPLGLSRINSDLSNEKYESLKVDFHREILGLNF